jgi:phage shock protein C
MYCNACGKGIAEDARYCAYCGTVLGYASAPKKMMRSRSDRKVAGVCAGAGHYLDLDVTLVRLMWVLITIVSGIFPGVLVYVLAWIIVPEEPLSLPSGAHTRPMASASN